MKNRVRAARRGLTLLEVLVSLLILAMVMAGLSNVFVVARRYLIHSKSRMSAAEAANYLLSPLQCEVRQDTFDLANNTLTVTSPTRTGTQVNSNGIDYNSTFSISNVTDASGLLLRKVNLTVNWNEPDQ